MKPPNFNTMAPLRLLGQIRMLSTLKGYDLTPWEAFETIWEFNSIPGGGYLPVTTPTAIFVATIESHFRLQATEYFVAKLKSDREFQKLIGGMHWKVDLRDLSCENGKVVAANYA